jgi:hypothetical protein
MSHFARLFAYASAFFCLLCAPSFAQQYFAPGYPVFSTQVGSQYDQIDLADSNISITLPLRSINAGPIPLSFMMSGQSNAYSANPSGSGTSWFVTTPSFGLLASSGASRTLRRRIKFVTATSTPSTPTLESSTHLARFILCPQQSLWILTGATLFLRP